MTSDRIPRVTFQPTTYQNMQRGIDQVVGALRPTLGPLPRIVAMEARYGKAPELLDNGGIIVRRILELGDREADVGAMYLRHLLWRVYEKVGDGTATTAVLFEAIYKQGIRYIAAGGNAMQLRHYLEQGMQLILCELSMMAIPTKGRRRLAEVAESICHDPALAQPLGEIFDTIGEFGHLEIREGYDRQVRREFVVGTYWDSQLLSQAMVTNQAKGRADLEEATILISDLELDNADEMMRFLARAKQANLFNLLIIARKLSDLVLALLLKANRESGEFHIIAAKTPGTAILDQSGVMEDLAILTGGRPVVQAAGQTLKGVSGQDLGQARRVWADRNSVGFMGGQGSARQVRRRVKQLQAALAQTSDADARKRLQQRTGKLLGGTGVLYIGAASETEMTFRKEMAQRTATTVRGAVAEGVVPGGGVALLACQAKLRDKLEQSNNLDERMAYQILLTALEAPIRTIVANAGYEPSQVMAKIKRVGTDYGFDARTGRVVNMAKVGIWDGTAVIKAALHGAVSGAALALTTDVIVYHKAPKQSLEP